MDAVDALILERDADPDGLALTLVDPRGPDQHISWRRLVEEAERAAGELSGLGVRSGDRALIALGTSREHFSGVLGAWMVGLLVLPVPPGLKGEQRRSVLDGFRPHVVRDAEGWRRTDVRTERERGPLATPRTSTSALLSGGTSGHPKIILRRRPWTRSRGGDTNDGPYCRRGDATLVCTPLYGMGFQTAWESMLHGNRTIVLRRFSPAAWLRAVETYGVTFTRMVPTQMKWVAEAADFPRANLATLRVVHHTAAPCPHEVKRIWLERLSPHVVYESYSSREDILSTVISGDEWLRHPGSVGRVDPRVVRILDERLSDVPAGVLGRIFMRPHDGHPRIEGTEANLSTTPDGKFVSLGDLGTVDEEGYLYLVDRSSEVFTTGGMNVFPAQVEQQLAMCPSVHDCVVIGEENPDLGHVAVAYVSLKENARLADVVGFAADRLAGPELPSEFRQVAAVPRDASGKISRRTLVAEVRVESGVSPRGGRR